MLQDHPVIVSLNVNYNFGQQMGIVDVEACWTVFGEIVHTAASLQILLFRNSAHYISLSPIKISSISILIFLHEMSSAGVSIFLIKYQIQIPRVVMVGLGRFTR